MVNAFRWMIFVIVLAVVIGSIMITTGEPILDIDSPYDGEIVTSEKITVYGHVRGTGGVPVESVTVNGIKATGDPEWRAEVSLHPGSNPITVVATDDMGQSRSETITVIYNPPTPPIQPPRYDGAPSAIPTPTPTPTGSISITTSPSGAEVYLDDSPTKKNTNITLENVTVGYHEIKVTKEGYHSEKRIIRLWAGKTKELNIPLTQLTVSIFVCSTPSGARVHLDDVYIKDKITPCMLKVAVGPHIIKLTKSGYFDAIRKVSVPADGLFSLDETLTRCGSITISSDPPGAEVSLDGKYTGETTPANISKVAQGNHTIKLTKFGYFIEKRKVGVSVAKTYLVHVNLSGYGYITISSDPSGARVYLDGNCTGVTPKNISEVSEGNYSIRLTKRRYKDVTQEIQVSAGKTTSIFEPLSLTFRGRTEPWAEIYAAIIGAIVVIFLTTFKWLIPRFSKEKDLLFGLDPSYRQHLKEGDVTKLKKVFKDNHHPLPATAEVSIIKDDEHWEIVVDDKKQYKIEDTKNKKQLNVYKK